MPDPIIVDIRRAAAWGRLPSTGISWQPFGHGRSADEGRGDRAGRELPLGRGGRGDYLAYRGWIFAGMGLRCCSTWRDTGQWLYDSVTGDVHRRPRMAIFAGSSMRSAPVAMPPDRFAVRVFPTARSMGADRHARHGLSSGQFRRTSSLNVSRLLPGSATSTRGGQNCTALPSTRIRAYTQAKLLAQERGPGPPTTSRSRWHSSASQRSLLFTFCREHGAARTAPFPGRRAPVDPDAPAGGCSNAGPFLVRLRTRAGSRR